MASKKKKKPKPKAKQGKIFYTYYAVGRGGKAVEIVKVQTMRWWGQRKAAGGEMRFGKYVGSPNITPLGRFLRRKHIDELPQLPAVITGRLKPVGMRPMIDKRVKKLPGDLKEFYLEHGPGWISAAYATPKMPRTAEEVREAYRGYIEYKKKRPYLADWVYGGKALWNVFVRGYGGA